MYNLVCMQIRKLVKSGHSSLVVAVPRDWIKRNKLKPGDLVYIDDSSNKLVVSTEFKENVTEKREKVINIDGMDEIVILREINTAYLNNYYYIIIKGDELKKHLRYVKKLISDLVALELVDESSEKIMARSFLNVHDTDLKVLVRRVDNILRSMIIDTKQALNEPSLVEAVVDRDNEVNRLNLLMAKVLKAAYYDKSILTSLGMDEMELLRYWELNGHLEKIGDRTKDIATAVLQLKKVNHKDFLKLFSEMEDLYKEAMMSFYKNSYKISDEVTHKRRVIMADIGKYITKNSKCAACAQIGINSYNMTAHINDIGRIIRYMS